MGVAVEPDVTVLAVEAEGEPALALAPVAAAKRLADEFGRQIVGQPLRMFADHCCVGGPDLLLQLAEDGHLRILIVVDAALGSCRQLVTAGPARRPTNTRPSLVEQHGADVGAIRQVRHFGAPWESGVWGGSRRSPARG